MGRNGVLYPDIRPRHDISNLIDIYRKDYSNLLNRKKGISKII